MTGTEQTPADADRAPATTTAASDGRPVIEARRDRLRAYLRHNGERICRDAIVLGSWALVMTSWFQWTGPGFSRWMYYAVTFVGIVGYAQLTSPWTRPYRSPGDSNFERFERDADERQSEKSEQRHE
ncbi:hypothetical protein [Halopiger djelfimassiliensis]|uniref:hypothetical protein n=1 Tax=Halopiger djelfimassiliensis TaxID=1293047 RepID=UPI000677EAB7|nr:hypothetical protein [Halopiger djelfimassiliensis]